MTVQSIVLSHFQLWIWQVWFWTRYRPDLWFAASGLIAINRCMTCSVPTLPGNTSPHCGPLCLARVHDMDLSLEQVGSEVVLCASLEVPVLLAKQQWQDPQTTGHWFG